MSRASYASLLSVLVAACGGKSSPPPAPPTPEPAVSTNPVIVRVVAHADAMCACKDAACGHAAEEDVERWADEHRDEIMASFSDRLRAIRIESELGRADACKAKLGMNDDDDDDDDGGDDDGDPTITIDEALARMNALTDELCACKDMACAEATFKTMASLKEPSAKPSKAEMEQAMKIAERMAGCQKALMAAEPPEPPPPPPDPRLKAPVAADLAVYLKGIKGLKAKGKLTATIATNLGSFHCELYEKQVPATVANFVGLATGQKPWRDPGGEVQEHAPFYDGLRFHRVIPGFMIQGGDPADDGTGGPGYAFDNEIVAELHHDGAGVLSMANAGPGTNGSQFFITAAEATHLDGKHTVFGRCAEVDLVEKITALHGDDDHPTRPVILRSITFARR